MQPAFGMMLGGWEIILILVVFLGIAALAAVVVGVILVATRSKRPPSAPSLAASQPGPGAPRDLEQELRTLARLKEQGLITEDEYARKRKAALGL